MESPRETPKDAVAIAIEANSELAPPPCLSLFCHRIYQPQPRICPRSRPVHPNLLPANSFGSGTAGASEDWRDVCADVGAGPAWSRGFNMGRIVNDIQNLLDW